mmetsp:Transcript_22774/g.17201  ORF Transcript_22774/g.17201 Transcript_22774/m.17201 type:complete len:82 (+) Transcript_22774:1051-1296(+)
MICFTKLVKEEVKNIGKANSVEIGPILSEEDIYSGKESYYYVKEGKYYCYTFNIFGESESIENCIEMLEIRFVQSLPNPSL